MILFIIKSTINLLVVYVIYTIFFARENAPVFKRYFLISGIVFSFLISFLKFDLQTITEKVAILPTTVSDQIIRIDAAEAEILLHNSLDWEIKNLIVTFYLAVLLLLSIRYVLNIKKIIISGKNAIQAKGYKLAVLKGDTGIYSFLNTIYINEKDYNNGAIRKEILIHELTHIKQKHSIDILFIEFLQVIFWFNPFLILFKKEIQLNHEHLADNGVINSDISMSDYQNFILNSVFRNNSSYLASSFNYSFIKKRFIMLSKEKSTVRASIKAMIAVPMIILLALLIAFNQGTRAEVKWGELTEWWQPILQKHNVKIAAFNNFGDVFEMGEINSSSNNLTTLTNATMIIRGDVDDYVLIQADLIERDTNSGMLKVVSGTLKTYNMDSDISNPLMSMVCGELHINLNDIIDK